MKISPSDPSFVPDLLAFLREHGCLAYSAGEGEITAMVPELTSVEETRVLRGLVKRSRLVHPLVEVDIRES